MTKVSKVDFIFLGEQSPIINNPNLIIAKTTKTAERTNTRVTHCPSSFVLVGPFLKSGELPLAAKNLPDWCLLLKIVNLLAISTKPESYQGADDSNMVLGTIFFFFF